MGGFSSLLRGFAPTATGPAPGLTDILGTALSAVSTAIQRRGTGTVTTVPTTVPTLPGLPQIFGPGSGMPVLRPMEQVFGRRRRRMNLCNMRALNRAIRRVRGFEKRARKVLTITTGKRPGVRLKRRK